jgi:cob(I)alamin adenosyltransferase
MVGVADEKDQFLAELQSELDRLGFNSAEGVARVSTLPPDHPQLLQLAQSIAVSCGIDLAMVKNLLKKWSGDQATVRDEIRKQIEEEEKAKVEQREAMVPIWRCAVCGRADQPFIACYVQPYVVRYEKRRLK